MYPWGNQGQPPLLVQFDSTVRPVGARGTQRFPCNPDNHPNDGQSSAERGAMAIRQSQSIFMYETAMLYCMWVEKTLMCSIGLSRVRGPQPERERERD